MSDDDRPAPQDGENPRCFEVIQDVLIRHQRLIYGDLFLTYDELVFTPVASVTEPEGGAARNATLPVRGWGSMLGLVNLGRELEGAKLVARDIASRQRKLSFGLSVEARKRQGRVRPDPVVTVNRGSVHSLQLDPDAGTIEVAGAFEPPLIMQVPQATQLFDHLRLWRRGRPIYVDSDRQGLDLNLPPHVDMLAWIEDPSTFPCINQDDAARAAQATAYLGVLVRQLKGRPLPERERICRLAKDRSVPLGVSIIFRHKQYLGQRLVECPYLRLGSWHRNVRDQREHRGLGMASARRARLRDVHNKSSWLF